MKILLTYGVLFITVFTHPVSCSAVAIIMNGSFESPDTTPAGTQGFIAPSSAITGWTLSQGSVYLFDNANAVGNAYAGSQFLDLVYGGPGATLSQSITGLSIGQAYQISYVVTAYENAAYFGPSSVTVSMGSGSSVLILDPPGSSVNFGVPWISQSFSFAATSDTMDLVIVSSRPGNQGSLPAIDAMAITVVPEPSIAGLLLLGLSAVAARSRKSRVSE